MAKSKIDTANKWNFMCEKVRFAFEKTWRCIPICIVSIPVAFKLNVLSLTTQAENVEILVRSKNNEFRSKYNPRCLGEIVVYLTSSVAGTPICYDLGFIPFALKYKVRIFWNLFWKSLMFKVLENVHLQNIKVTLQKELIFNKYAFQ